MSADDLSTYGGDRNPSISGAQMNILQEIQYPTGGKTEFEFEPNRTNDPYFYGYPNQNNANNGVVGGVRVRSIKNYSADNVLSSQKTFIYNSIGAQNKIGPALFYYQQPYHYYYTETQNGGPTGIKDHYETFDHVCTSSSVYPLTAFAGSPIIYSQVTEYQGTESNNIGKTVYTYDIPPETTMESSNLLSSPKFISGSTLDHGSPNPLLKSTVTYRNGGGTYQPVKSNANIYTYLKTNEFLTGIRVDWVKRFIDKGGYYTSDQPDAVLWDYLDSYNWEATKGYEHVALIDSNIITDFSNPSAPVTTITKMEYGNPEHLQPTRKTVTTSVDNERIITDFKYPHDFSGAQPYSDMVNNYHVWNPVIETVESKFKPSASTMVTAATKTDYQVWNNDARQIYPALVSAKKGSNNYEPRIEYRKYDNNGNVTEAGKSSASSTSYLWGYQGKYPVAQVTGAKVNEVYHNNFEEVRDFPDWAVTLDGTHTHQGKYAGKIYNGGPVGSEITAHSDTWLSIDLAGQPKRFRYSCWVYSDGPEADLLLFMKKPGETGYYTDVVAVTNSVVGKWVLMQGEYTVAANITQLNLRIDNNGGGGNIWFDDLRIYPADAQMSTYTYDPLVGMTSATDAKGQASYYEYDEMGRLAVVRDQNKNIIKTICYNYLGQQTDCFALQTGNGQQTLYAMVQFDNYHQSYNGDSYDNSNTTTANASIKFFSDPYGNTPVTLTAGMVVSISRDYYWSDEFGSGSSNQINDYSIPAGVSSYNLGQMTINYNRSYTDYSGYHYQSEDYSYSVVSRNGSNYTPL